MKRLAIAVQAIGDIVIVLFALAGLLMGGHGTFVPMLLWGLACSVPFFGLAWVLRGYLRTSD
jgi:hypothetical protein